jgi:hypothetical protein
LKSSRLAISKTHFFFQLNPPDDQEALAKAQQLVRLQELSQDFSKAWEMQSRSDLAGAGESDDEEQLLQVGKFSEAAAGESEYDDGEQLPQVGKFSEAAAGESE